MLHVAAVACVCIGVEQGRTIRETIQGLRGQLGVNEEGVVCRDGGVVRPLLLLLLRVRLALFGVRLLSRGGFGSAECRQLPSLGMLHLSDLLWRGGNLRSLGSRTSC